MNKNKLGCVVMAAGNAKRFKENKLAVKFDGKSLIYRALEAVPKDIFYKVAVVTQYTEIMNLANDFGFIPVSNIHPDYGISHTIKLGMEQLMDCDTIMFMVSDQPLLEQESVKAMIEYYLENPDFIVAMGHDGVRGNPCIFPKEFFPALQRLEEDHGGSTVIRQNEHRLLLFEVLPKQLSDVDDRASLDKIKDEM